MPPRPVGTPDRHHPHGAVPRVTSHESRPANHVPRVTSRESRPASHVPASHVPRAHPTPSARSTRGHASACGLPVPASGDDCAGPAGVPAACRQGGLASGPMTALAPQLSPARRPIVAQHADSDGSCRQGLEDAPFRGRGKRPRNGAFSSFGNFRVRWVHQSRNQHRPPSLCTPSSTPRALVGAGGGRRDCPFKFRRSSSSSSSGVQVPVFTPSSTPPGSGRGLPA